MVAPVPVAETSRSAPPFLEATAARFALIEDDALLRDLLAAALRQRFQPKSLESFELGRDGLECCLNQPIDLLVTDLRLPDIDGREIVRQLRARQRKLRVIVLTGQVDATLPAELVSLGVAGFVDKGTPLEHAIRAVERVLAGGMYFFAGVAPSPSALVSRAVPGAGLTPSALTARERDIARLVGAGLSSKEIAAKLELSVRTVENYRAHLLHKLGLRDTPSLVRWCVQHGLE
jgi:DNA-binding NarL/FixJ family response regulator